jgi:hypothetical protein
VGSGIVPVPESDDRMGKMLIDTDTSEAGTSDAPGQRGECRNECSPGSQGERVATDVTLAFGHREIALNLEARSGT